MRRLSMLMSIFRSSAGAFGDGAHESETDWGSNEDVNAMLNSGAAEPESPFFLSSLSRLELCPGCDP